MLLDVATLTQRHPIGNFGHTVIGKPKVMMCMPSNTEWQGASFAPPVSTDVEMSFLAARKKPWGFHHAPP
jgi:hypothetical protein